MYKVLISKTATRDLKSAFEYIKYTLKNPVSAENLIASSKILLIFVLLKVF